MFNHRLVSVVISNYNKKDVLKDCLDSLLKQTYSNIEIIVVDNGSSDSSVSMVSNEYKSVILIKNEANEFFSKSQNKGIKTSRGEYVFCLNNDVILKDNFIEKLMTHADDNEKIGILTGKILSSDGDSIDSCGQFLGASRRAIERGYGSKDLNLYPNTEFVFGACGAACVLKKEMLDTISVQGEYFDEDFEIFFEDLDLNWRANNLGWKALYISDAVCFHRRATSTLSEKKHPLFRSSVLPNIPINLQINFIRNRYLLMLKNDTPKNFLLNLPFIFMYDLKIWIYVVLFRPKVLFSIATYRFYFKKALQKRKISPAKPL